MKFNRTLSKTLWAVYAIAVLDLCGGIAFLLIMIDGLYGMHSRVGTFGNLGSLLNNRDVLVLLSIPIAASTMFSMAFRTGRAAHIPAAAFLIWVLFTQAYQLVQMWQSGSMHAVSALPPRQFWGFVLLRAFWVVFPAVLLISVWPNASSEPPAAVTPGQ